MCFKSFFIESAKFLFFLIIFFESQRKFEKTLDERDLKMKEEQQIKDERRHQEKIESEALYFIQKYNANDEIQLLALCVIASKFNSAFPYRRQIYKDFCCLNTEVQKSILKKI